jgi:CubicO group peptidase (beta-lactamase class C family)
MSGLLPSRPFFSLAWLITAIAGAALAPAHAQSPPAPEQIERAIGQIDGMVAQLMQRTGIPGMAVAVVQGNRLVYAKGFGVRAAGSPQPVDADTVFQLASMSKPIGATVVAQQVGAGKVTWETPMRKHLPGFSLGNAYASENVTIGDLYAHRSGLPDHAGDTLEELG